MADKTLIFAPEADEDIALAYDWYEERRPGLGEEFLSCLDACIQRICRTPEGYAPVHRGFRRALIRRFPYGVFFDYSESQVTIYAVFHNAREPGKWRERLT